MIVAEPFGFFDYCKLQSESLLSISDSGSISEEAAILGTKSLTLRNSMERQEALESGVVPLAGLDRPELISIIEAALALDLASSPPIEYSIEDSSLRVLKFMLSTIGEYKFWKNLR